MKTFADWSIVLRARLDDKNRTKPVGIESSERAQRLQIRKPLAAGDGLAQVRVMYPTQAMPY